MTFAWIHVLWLLALPIALSAWDGVRQRVRRTTTGKILTAEAGTHTLTFSARTPAAQRPRLWLWFGLAFAIVALARPQWGRVEEPVFDQSREILLAVDLSRSMLAQDVKPSRLERAKLLIQSLLERLKGERVGLVVFSGTAFLQSPLSADYEVLREFLPALGPDYLPEGGSNYASLLDAAVGAFSATNSADRFLIVLSDGEATDDNWKKSLAALKGKKVRVIGLGVGTEAGAMIPDGSGGFVKDERGAVVLSRLGKATLQQLADATGGVYADASTWVNLGDLLNQTVEAGQKGKFVEKSNVRLIERFQWALAPAVLCFLLSFWREFPVRPRPRDLRVSSPAAKTTATAAAVLAGLLFAPPFSPARAAETGTSNLGPMIARLSGASAAPTARDWSELGHETVRWGQRLQASQQPVPAGPVQDALAAADLGEKLDSHVTDWPKLRQELQSLLEKPEPPPQQQQDQQKKDDQQKQSQDQKDSSKSKSSSDQSESKPDQQKQNQSQSGQPDAKNASPDQQQQSQQKESPSGDQQPPESKSGQSAFGDMQKSTPPPAPPPSGDTQTVGGAREKKDAAGQPADAALALPLQKLEQLRTQDSPAKLFQLMEGDSQKSPPPANGKNW